MAQGPTILEQQYVIALEKCPGMMRRFVEAYLEDPSSIRKAAQIAGYQSRPDVAGTRCMQDTRVRDAISAGERVKAEVSLLKVEKVLNELSYLVHSDIRDYRVNEKTGRLRLRKGALPSAYRAVSSVKVKKRRFKNRRGELVHEVDYEIKLWDKNAALEKAMRHLGLLKNDVNLNDTALERFLRERAQGLHAGVVNRLMQNTVAGSKN